MFTCADVPHGDVHAGLEENGVESETIQPFLGIIL
jgi:hypothetical protein